MNPRYITDINMLEHLSKEEKEKLEPVVEKYPFYANTYYLGLIDWEDPNDPIRRIIIPSNDELRNGGALDPSNERRYTVCRGLEHKYGPTALLLVSRACGGVCRFCFRKRIFMMDNDDAVPDLKEALKYIRGHREINNVLISGGDPLMLPPKRIRRLISTLDSIPHVRFMRIGTKIPAYNPHRIIGNQDLLDVVREFSSSEKKLYFVTDFNHPRELTSQAKRALSQLQDAGAVITNQTPLLKGVNDDERVLSELFNGLASMGIPPYYVFQCRPTVGNSTFSVPIEKGYSILEATKENTSGLAKRSRFIISHRTGKLEVCALTGENIIFKYHNAAREEDTGRVLVFRRNENATWLDDYTEMVESFSPGDTAFSAKQRRLSDFLGAATTERTAHEQETLSPT